MATYEHDIATQVADLRQRLGITQEQLAQRLGVSRLSVLRWENGRARPSHAVRQRLGEIDASAAAAAVRSEPRGFPGRLPHPPTRLIGRDDELEVLLARLDTTRLLTLTGPGGCGKTRLAVAVGRVREDREYQAVCFVELGGVEYAEHVVPTLARALGVRERASMPLLAAVQQELAHRPLLLVLDNCEHLIATCAAAIARLLASSEMVRVLTTSREPLGIAGEVVWPVPPLALSATDTANHTAAVALFAERAAARRAGFSLSVANLPAVTEICIRLDGLPLAIELAAARITLFSAPEILQRLDDRFRLLAGGDRNAPWRQQSLLNTISWSYDLLSPAEQTVFQRLSVFPDSFDAAAGEAVGAGSDSNGDVLDLLGLLVEKSLVVMRERDGEARYALLDSLRAFGRQLLMRTPEMPAVFDRHASHYLALAGRIAERVFGTESVRATHTGAVEQGNWRGALRWLESRQSWNDFAELATSLWQFWKIHGAFTELRDWLERGLRAPADSLDVRHRAGLLIALGNCLWQQGAPAEARAALDGALTLCIQLEDRSNEARARFQLGAVAHNSGDSHLARELYREALRLERGLGMRREVVSILNNLGLIADQDGDHEVARELLAESAAVARALGSPSDLAIALNNLATLAQARGDEVETRSFAHEALAIARSLDQRQVVAASLNNLALIDHGAGALDEARIKVREALELYTELGNRRGLATTLAMLGSIACTAGDREAAADLHRRALTLRAELGDQLQIAESLLGIARLFVLIGRPKDAARLLGAVSQLLAGGRSLPPGAESLDATLHSAGMSLTAEAFEDAFSAGGREPLDAVLAAALEPNAFATVVRAGSASAAVQRSHDKLSTALTAREAEVLSLLVLGHSNKEIGRALSLSVRTVERHVLHTYAKLGARRRADAVALAVQQGLVARSDAR